MAFGIISIGMKLLQHRESIARIVAVLPELKNILDDLTPDKAPPLPSSTGYVVGSMSWLQDSLNTLGAQPPLDFDGEYGPATNKAVAEFQKTHGLDVDGWAGPETVSAIVEALAA